MPVKERIGRVISDKMQKTITVLVETRVIHPRYKKTITRRKKFYAHDEREEARVGDVVRIRETRPLSKLKRWRLVEILQRAPTGVSPLEEGVEPEEEPEVLEVERATAPTPPASPAAKDTQKQEHEQEQEKAEKPQSRGTGTDTGEAS